MGRIFLFGLAILLAGAFITAPVLGSTLEDVRKRGELRCWVAPSLPGYAFPDKKGNWSGFEVDFCRAVAAAVGVKVKFDPSSPRDRFNSLALGSLDIMTHATWTISRDTRLSTDFVAVVFYDGQGFMVRKSLGVDSAKKLNNASVCVLTGTTTELNLADYFRSNGMKYRPVVFDNPITALKAYDNNRCDVLTNDASGLAARKGLLKNPDENILLPEIISKEPLGIVVRHGDNQWADIVRWVHNAMIIAEEKGITQANVERMARTSKDPEVQRMLGKTGSVGKDLGLSSDWALNAIKAAGNYGENFARNLGKKSKIGLSRGLNRLWNKGGLIYAPPIR